jgi:hypothetical protein
MSQRTIHKCDRCGVEIEMPSTPLIRIEVTRGDRVRYYSGGCSTEAVMTTDGRSLYAEWCIECLRKVGIDGGHPKAVEVAPSTPPTIEDIIRELVAVEVANQRNA